MGSKVKRARIDPTTINKGAFERERQRPHSTVGTPDGKLKAVAGAPVQTLPGASWLLRQASEESHTISSSLEEDDSASHETFKSLGIVYANELASRAYTGTKSQVFPVGSIIVREKLSRPDSKQPEILAVMIKREPGFNPAGGDWLFLTVNGDASKVQARMKQGACLNCHRSARERDFVFKAK